MEKNIEENIFLLPGILILAFLVNPTSLVVLSLGAVILTEINLILFHDHSFEKVDLQEKADQDSHKKEKQISKKEWIRIILVVLILMVGCLCYLPILCFLPVIAYELGWQENKHYYLLLFLYVWFMRETLILTDRFSILLNMFLAFSILAAALLGRKSYEKYRNERMLIKVRDSAKEMELKLKETNKELLENKDASVHMATLSERNRIAREIHDNVGHMLSRTILQLAALLTIYKEEPLNSQLQSINETVNEAMNNIRESVHDLHNDSLDLRQALLDATSEMKRNYDLTFDYDMSDKVNQNVKYCFLSIVKEAMANIVKHSNATKINLTLREHPGFYQLAVFDNGTTESKQFSMENSGIGLKNMSDRVEGLGGNIHITAEDGFKIMISVPKLRNMYEEIKNENNHCR